MAVTSFSRLGDQNFPTPSENQQKTTMSALPARFAFGAERALRPAVMPRQVSGPVPAKPVRRSEPRPVKDDDFLQRLRESGL